MNFYALIVQVVTLLPIDSAYVTVIVTCTYSQSQNGHVKKINSIEIVDARWP